MKTSIGPRLVAAALVLGLSAVVHAHMRLTASVPAKGAVLTAAPTTVSVTFSEKIDQAVSRITLVGPSGEIKVTPPQIMGGTQLVASVQGPIADGAYKVTWQSAGTDGHVLKGEIPFSVKRKAN